MRSYLLPGLFLGLVFCINLKAAIIIDGVLDEKEWETARKIDTFYEVYPYSLKEVDDYMTQVLLLESEEGLYFGFKNYQPNETMRIMNHMRDQERSISDKNGIVIDFNGDGVEGYNFFVSSSGSKGDGTVRNEKDRNWDWDADWEAAATVDNGVWYTESFIPWTVASMKSQSGDIRKIKMAFYRMMMGIGKGVSTIKGSPFENLYLSVFNEYEVKNYSGSKLDFFPYVTMSEDIIGSDLLSKAGAEIFWKIDSSRQVNLTLNPDFGQVESDEVVVNFSAFETFYSDKRPFFAENNNMFDVSDRMHRIINTRRIGGRPDYDCSTYGDLEEYCQQNRANTSEIDFALKYTQKGNVDFGVMTASERDEKFSQGRDFYAFRLNTKSNNLKYGYLGTYVDKPVTGENAQVNSFDFLYLPSEIHRMNGNFMHSSVDNQDGFGLTLGYAYNPNRDFSSGIGINYYDDRLDLNDMGYLILNDRFMFNGRTQFKRTTFDEASILRSRLFEIGYGSKFNVDSQRESSNFALKLENSFVNLSELKAEIFYRSTGKNTRITRGSQISPFIKMPKGIGGYIDLTGPRRPTYIYGLRFERGRGSEHSPELGWGNKTRGYFKYMPVDNISLSLMYQHADENEWLNWLNDNLLATFHRKQRTSVVEMEWFHNNVHELRIKAQMVAFTGRNPQALLGDLSGNLNPEIIDIAPITISELAFQVRYRYEIMPLSYLYIVYSKGGRVSMQDDEDGLFSLYRRSWNSPEKENFTVKLRYRF
ncbi:DUF5916 domain-containing protein [SAR86 cluster bacterium]|nr:DUF5916 domain-containing protein [SAR86 cluster bacterium]